MRFAFLLLAAGLGAQVPDNVYRGALIAFPGPWAFYLPRASVILVSDEQLEDLTDPDKPVDLTLGRGPRMQSLRQVCEDLQRRGGRTLIVAIDHFFTSYRPSQKSKPRKLMPDMDEYIARIAKIGSFAQRYGLGLELSLLSPLEVGKAYAARTGETGVWIQYRKGLRDPESGAFSVDLWRHRVWSNNKGPIELALGGIRVFAFRETNVPGTLYRAVDPQSIVEIKEPVQAEEYLGLVVQAGDFRAVRTRVSGRGGPAGLNRVLIVQEYHTPELDYFSPRALPFLTNLVDRYFAAGVKLNALYSDEVHIQQDWAYFSHHDAGSLNFRYVTSSFARRFAELYGAEYGDFAKYLLYFVYGQDDFAHDLTPKQGVMQVFGASPERIRETALFRARYYRLLQDTVVDLFAAAKRYAESKAGYRLEARAHATWAQSPTIDSWQTLGGNSNRPKYEYTSNFLWSNTVHQAASACYDYFKWGDFLTGNGNDHAEGGWLDRNYYGLALASSTGVLNETPYSYGAHWGMPAEINRRRRAVADAFGAFATYPYAMVEGAEHRDTDVLMLYPLDLVAVEERFGSWMAQYPYANLITAQKLLERGRVKGAAIEAAGRRFSTLVASFEPFPSERLLGMMREFAQAGGRLIWSGPPPVLTAEGNAALAQWQEIFGVRYTPGRNEGEMAPGRAVKFSGALAGVPAQTILTDFLVDRIYAVEPQAGTEAVARVKDQVVGTRRGNAVFLGFRPRDDQSASLGDDVRTWFEILSALGAYAGAGHPERLSRLGTYLCARFPNGATALAPHLRDLEEDWPGGFARDKEQDDAWIARHALPTDELKLDGFAVNGRRVSYRGRGALAFRVDAAGELIAFAGERAKEIAIDGRLTVFASREMEEIAWAPVPEARRVPGGALVEVRVRGDGELRIPAAGLPARVRVYAEGATPGGRGPQLQAAREGATLRIALTPDPAARRLFVVPE